MGFKEQFGKIKDNWLIIVLVLILFVVVSGGLNLGSSLSYNKMVGTSSYGDYESDYYAARESYSPGYTQSSDFAPDVVERKITKTSYLTSEIDRGEFQQARDRLADIVKASEAYLLTENVNRYGTEKHPYFTGSYQIKVDATKYDSVVSQLKELGEVASFRESQTDITGSYTNLEIELDAEKARLVRYQAMLKDSTLVADKIILTDRISDLEIRVDYLEEALEKMDLRIDYSTIYLTMNEEQSGYANLAVVKFSELVRNLVGSFNALLYLLFIAVPWAVAIGVIILIARLIKARKA